MNATNITEVEARVIMGSNFFGMDDIFSHLGLILSQDQKHALSIIPFERSILEQYTDYLLVAETEVSIEDLKRIFPSLITFRSLDWTNSGRGVVVRRKLKAGWRLISKEPDPDSFGLDLEMQRCLCDGFEIPSATSIIYAAVAHYRKTGERILSRKYVRSSDLEVHNDRAVVGCFNELGILLNFGGTNDDNGHNMVGFLPEVRRRA